MTEQELARKITTQEAKIRDQDVQIRALKTAIAKMFQHISVVEKKVLRAADMSRTNAENINRVLKALTRGDE